MQQLKSNAKLIIEDVDSATSSLTFVSPDLSDIIKGISTNNSIWADYGRSYNNDRVYVLVKNIPEGEKFLRDEFINNEKEYLARYVNSDSLLLELAGDWNTLRGIYKNTFKKSIKRKENLKELNDANKNELLEAILNVRKTSMLNLLSEGSLRLASNKVNYLLFDNIAEKIKDLNCEKNDTQKIYYEPIPEEDVFPIAFSTLNHKDSIIIVNKEENKYIITRTKEEGFENILFESDDNLLNALSSYKLKDFEYIKLRKEEANSFLARNRNFDFSFTINNALKTTKILSASIDVSTKNKLKETARSLRIKGYTTMGEDELLEAIGLKAIQDNPLSDIINKPGVFLRRSSSSRYNPFDDEKKEKTPTDNSQEKLITAYISSIEARGNNQKLRFAHKDIIPLPATRIPREKPGIYESDQELEILEIPDFLK